MIDSKSGGGGKNYYDLPPNAAQLLDLIEYVNMNGNIKDIFKACYRLGRKKGISREYDLRKMVLYSLRELGRELDRKDYIQLAHEVIGHHDKVTPYTIRDLEMTTSTDFTDLDLTHIGDGIDKDMIKAVQDAEIAKLIHDTKITYKGKDADGLLLFFVDNPHNSFHGINRFFTFESFKMWFDNVIKY